VKPLRIAILTTDKRDHDRDYANPMPGFGTAPEALLQGFTRLPEVEIHVVSCVHRPVNSPAKIAPNIFFHSMVVPKIGWMRTLYQGCIRAVRKKLREIQPDIVHGQGTEMDCGLGAIFSGFPNVLTIHGNMRAVARFYQAKPGSFLWLAAQLENFTLPRTGGVFCNSIYTRKLVASRAGQTWLVPNAVRPIFFDVPIAPVVLRRPVLLNIGVLQPYKRQRELLALARRLYERGLSFEMQFVGERTPHTTYGAAFERELLAAEAAGYARHLGLKSATELIPILDAASALVHCSAEESFGLVVAEALARNRKFFGAATGGVVDIAEDMDGAELFPSGDFKALEAGLARWLSNGAPLPKTCAQTALSRYHPTVIARKHLEIYREVLKAKAER
jgi:glycosyltransferase involved in cell wall biosynthesis